MSKNMWIAPLPAVGQIFSATQTGSSEAIFIDRFRILEVMRALIGIVNADFALILQRTIQTKTFPSIKMALIATFILALYDLFNRNHNFLTSSIAIHSHNQCLTRSEIRQEPRLISSIPAFHSKVVRILSLLHFP